MIHSIRCDHPTFKTVNFNPGFNVILSERTQEATQKDSRNGLGKSTLIEIVHFCLGGNKGETLKKPQMDNWAFTLELDLEGERYSVTRNTKGSNKIIIDGNCSDWSIELKVEGRTGKKVLTNDDWKKVLGVLMFDLPVYESEYTPTFRSLISYFARKNGQSGAFLNPFQHYKNQSEWDIQVNNAYLLGLGWEFASKWQVLKDRNNVLVQIKKEATTGLISSMMGSIGELEARKINLETQISQEKEQINNFKVHPQYTQLEEKANKFTIEIHELVNQNISDKRLIEYYEASLKDEIEADPKKVINLYKEAGVVLPELITKKIADVLSFHKNIVTNRKAYLSLEIEKIRQSIEKRDRQIYNFTSERAELMLTLKTHGALEEWTQLQSNYQTIVAELKDVSNKLENLKTFEQGKSANIVEQELLLQEAKNDTSERKSEKEEAIRTFNSYSKILYSEPGTLSIDIEKTGFRFNVFIERSGSHGISNMKIFCYDLMMAKIWAKKMPNQIFLIHDSIIFADVDERQKALALQLAKTESEKYGFQYICTINSDNVPRKDFDKEFDFDKYIVKTFTDAREDGGLLGIRF